MASETRGHAARRLCAAKECGTLIKIPSRFCDKHLLYFDAELRAQLEKLWPLDLPNPQRIVLLRAQALCAKRDGYLLSAECFRSDAIELENEAREP